MKSKIYLGFVEHTRFRPRRHSLRYHLYVYCIDLDELETLDRERALFGYNRFRPVSIHDGDYLDDTPGSVRDKLLRLLPDGLAHRVGRVLLITQPRYFTPVFNPVSFYYCLDADDSLVCAVAEVNNTFGEKHVYVLTERQGDDAGFPASFRTDKAFHVSPFNRVEGAYILTFSWPGTSLTISVDLFKDNDRFFTATLTGRELPMTTRSQLGLMLTHPLVPRLTMARIYWEAAKLYFLRGLAYNPKPAPASPMTIRKSTPGMADRLFFSVIDRLLSRITRGTLTVGLPDSTVRVYGSEAVQGTRAHLRVNDYAMFTRVALHGEIGLGESYTDGMWDSDDLAGVLGLLVENRTALGDGNLWLSALSRARNFRLHKSRPNTLEGSKSNIEAHYDLNADFYRTFLDSTMTYSCGIFGGPEDTLENAQHTKIRSVIEKARIGPGDRVLEIGCGWGGLAVEAVRATGCRWTGITVSRTQYEYASDLVRREGLEGNITVLLEDYRNVLGSFDRIVCVEMIEAVGHEFLGEFFASCDRVLAPHGIVFIQAITIPDQRYDRHRTQPNWIQKHIFPGGMLPSLTALCTAMTSHSRLIVESVENIGMHYAPTLRHWRERFEGASHDLDRMGYDKALRRTWVYYFALCEAQFRMRALNDIQMVLVREGNRRLMEESPERGF